MALVDAAKKEISQSLQSVDVLETVMKHYMNTVLQSSMQLQIKNFVKKKF